MKSVPIIHFAFLSMVTPMAWAQAETTETGDRGSDSGAITATLALTGALAPDGNGNFDRFGFPSINERGAVAVDVVLSGTQMPGVDDLGIYLFDSQGATKLVRSGEPVPNGNGVFDRFSGSLQEQLVALNDQDRVAFAAELTNTAMPESDDEGLFGAHPTDGVTEYVRISDSAPDGNGVFGLPECCPDAPWRALSPPGLDNQGEVAFFGYLINPFGGVIDPAGGPPPQVEDYGIFRADGVSVVRLARLGHPASVGGATVDRITPQFGSSSIGQVTMETKVDVEGNDDDRIYLANGGAVEEAFVGGGAPPDGDGVIENVVERSRIAENGTLTFQAFVNNTADPLDEGKTLFFHDGVTLHQIARRDQLAPGETELFRFESLPGLDSNNQNEVVLSAVLRFDTDPVATIKSVIYRWNAGEGLTVALREGDPAPDGNGTFGSLAVPVFLNDNGQIAFEAEIEGTIPPPDLLSDVGLFVLDPDGTLHTVARTGQMLEGRVVALPRSLAGSGLVDDPDGSFDDGDFQLRLGGIDMINNSGQAAFSVIFNTTPPEWGLFLWNGPLIFARGFEDGTLDDWSNSP